MANDDIQSTEQTLTKEEKLKLRRKKNWEAWYSKNKDTEEFKKYQIQKRKRQKEEKIRQQEEQKRQLEEQQRQLEELKLYKEKYGKL
jgi:vacuolar-type H+-ATPase subunit I/STV1